MLPLSDVRFSDTQPTGCMSLKSYILPKRYINSKDLI